MLPDSDKTASDKTGAIQFDRGTPATRDIAAFSKKLLGMMRNYSVATLTKYASCLHPAEKRCGL